LESLESQKLRRDIIFEYVGEINCGRTSQRRKAKVEALGF
jgi:hypothetical protein